MRNKKIFFLFLVLICHSIKSQTVDRIEPPNWWTGMKDPNLQIMLYGNNIGKLKPQINYKGIKTIRSSSPESPNYLFIDLVIKPSCKPGNIPIKLSDGTNEIISFSFPLHGRAKGSADRIGFNSSDVIYLITPDRFANGNPSNDNIDGMKEVRNRNEKYGRHGGDLEGIRQRLDYIDGHGFTSIWINPVLENDMPRASYHGYATTDYYKIDPRLGTNESYRTFCHEASDKGIKIIMDMITNHIGLDHWWMTDPPTTDWINQYRRPYVETNHRKTISMDLYAAKEDADILTKGWFVPTMPDLNVMNPFLGNYLVQNAIWWIEYAGLAGIRLDTYLYPQEEYMSAWSGRIMKEYPKFNIVGEVWHENPSIVSYWQSGKKNSNGYVSHLPSLFDFPVKSALIKSLTTPDTWEDGWMFLYEMVAQDFQYADPNQLVVFTDNHDLDRTYTVLGEDLSKLKLALAYLFTTRGIPQIFYGTEILMTNKNRNDHDDIRSEFPGGWEGEAADPTTGRGLTEKQKETQGFVKRILSWRKNANVIHHGKMIHYSPEDGIYVYFRYDDKRKVMVILNKNEKPITLNLNRFKNMIQKATYGTDIITGEKIPLGRELHLTEARAIIIEIYE